jgi:hypothetical protein
MADQSGEETAKSDVGDENLAGAHQTRHDAEYIRNKVRRSFELVPEIGTRWRWYDVPYRLLSWMLKSWRRKVLPVRMRHRINGALNFFLAFDQFERSKVQPLDDPMENIIVPEGEEALQGGIWVAEFFPPSYYSPLLNSLKKNGWDQRNYAGALDGTNAEQIARARRGEGFRWARLGTVASPHSRYLAPDAKRETLPEEFELIELTAVQLGSSLTVIVAFVRLSERGQGALSAVWKGQHEPTLEWRGLRRPNVENRYFAAIQATQRERQRLHDLARNWLTDRCGGYFANTLPGQPVVDLTLFREFNPLDPIRREFGDALRALGMGEVFLYHIVSPQLPGAVLVQGEALRRPFEPLRNCWGVIGSCDEVNKQSDRPGYGTKPYSVSTLAAMHDDAVRGFLLYTAIEQYGRQLRETASEARDTARIRHREFKPRQLEQLKRELLTDSLDLPMVARDTESLWSPGWRAWNGITVESVPIPGTFYPSEKFDVIKRFGESRKSNFKQLLDDDAAYRGVLATVSALGASAATARLGRRALFVSGTSLLVSITALLVSHNINIWHHIAHWYSAIF